MFDVIPTPEQVEAFGARINDRIDALFGDLPDDWRDYFRKRVESDVRAYRRNTEGLRNCYEGGMDPNKVTLGHNRHAARYTEGRDEAWQNLKNTGELYGVQP